MKKKNIIPALIIIVLIFISITIVFVRCNHANGNSVTNNSASAPAANDSLAFGDSKWIGDGLKGKIYFLPEGTSSLPAFDSMQSMGTIYTRTLDIPNRSWTSGFPGIPDRFEWFGIEYKGIFRVKKAGHYSFRLVSDDGAKLFIDGQLVINNDGLHPVSAASGEFDLDNDEHAITVQYYQGPRFYIALQLFAKLDKASVFKDRASSNVVIKKFTFPNLKEGCIIEYTYTVNSPRAFNLRGWVFQGKYPVLQSNYETDIPTLFNYVFLNNGYFSYKIHTNDGREYSEGICKEGILLGELKNNKQLLVNNTFITRELYTNYQRKFETNSIKNIQVMIEEIISREDFDKEEYNYTTDLMIGITEKSNLGNT